MKLLYWTPIFWPDIGGIELITLRLIESMKERGHEIVVLTSHGRVKTEDISNHNGICIHRFPMVSSLYNNDLKQLFTIQKEILKIKNEFRPDIEHLNFGGPVPIGFFYLQTAKTYSAPLIVSLRTSINDFDASKKSVTGNLLRKAAWVTGVSQAILKDAQKIIPEILSRSSVIYNGIVEETTQPTLLPFKDKCILYIGRLVHEKGVDLVLKAFSQIIKSYPSTKLIIAGDGPKRNLLEKLSLDIQINHLVDFVGEYAPQTVFELINKATLVVVPSRYHEAFGQVALEASQMGRPVIASRVAGLEEIVIDQHTGLLVEMENSKAIAEAISFLLSNPDKAIQLGKNGYHRANSFFQWKKCVDSYENLYFNCRRLVNERKNNKL